MKYIIMYDNHSCCGAGGYYGIEWDSGKQDLIDCLQGKAKAFAEAQKAWLADLRELSEKHFAHTISDQDYMKEHDAINSKHDLKSYDISLDSGYYISMSAMVSSGSYDIKVYTVDEWFEKERKAGEGYRRTMVYGI